MKILETKQYHSEKDGEIIQIRYEEDWKVNDTPMYVIRNNELVKLSEVSN
jgi:hypothetical protein